MIALIGFLIYDIVQIYVVGHLRVLPDANLIFRYRFQWVDQFTIPPLTLVLLFIIPFLISYIFAIGSISNSDMVQIIGPDSLMHRIRMEFHKGNPEGMEFTPENVQYLLEDMAAGEPEGTLENLKMMFWIGNLVTNLIEKANVNSIKRVYMSDDLAPNAFTLRYIPIPYIGGDWIIINRNVVDILDKEEIQSVVAHEVGHAARKDSWVNSALYSPRLVIIFGWSIILAAMASIILNNPFEFDSFLRLMSLIIFFFIVRILMNAGHFITAYAYRKTELLADYYAAELVGSEVLINALIKIGQRGEVIRAINTELQWIDQKFQDLPLDTMSMRLLHYMDPSETNKERAREFAIQFYIRSKLNQIFRGMRISIDDEEFNSYIQEASRNIMQERGIQIEEEGAMNVLGSDRLESHTKDWKSVDIDQNDKLDLEEIRQLVTELRESGKKIFDTEALEEMGVVRGPRTHPKVSDRVTFLYDNLLD